MKFEKQNLILATLFFIVGVIVGLSSVFFLMLDFSSFQKEAEFGDFNFEGQDFFRGESISGFFVEIDEEEDLLFIESYDPSRKEEVVQSFKITNETVVQDISQGFDAPLIFESYSQAFYGLPQGVPLTLYAKDFSRDIPEILTVIIETGIPVFYEPTEF